MNYESFIAGHVMHGREATISLALLERGISKEVPALRALESWADGVCKRLGCTATIHVKSDVVTFYPGRAKAGEQT